MEDVIGHVVLFLVAVVDVECFHDALVLSSVFLPDALYLFDILPVALGQISLLLVYVIIAGNHLLPYVLFDVALGVLVLSSVFLPEGLALSSIPAASFLLVASVRRFLRQGDGSSGYL